MREDFSLYDIPCVTPEGERVKLRVALPMAFPRVKPVLTGGARGVPRSLHASKQRSPCVLGDVHA